MLNLRLTIPYSQPDIYETPNHNHTNQRAAVWKTLFEGREGKQTSTQDWSQQRPGFIVCL